MVFTKLLLENALAIRSCNWEAASEPHLPKVAHCIPVLPSRYIGKCATHVLKHSSADPTGHLPNFRDLLSLGLPGLELHRIASELEERLNV